MHTTQLLNADLNLLVVFVAVAEERSVSRAAQRLGLSQPAVSRALGRARVMFSDDLLVRGHSGFELTPLGQKLLGELEEMLPRLDRLMNETDFDPTRAEVTFRISSTDYATVVVCSELCKEFMDIKNKVTFDFTSWTDEVFEDIEHGRLDLILNADDGNAPANFSKEVLFEEEFVCVVAKNHQFSDQLTLEQYLASRHIGVSTFGGLQSIPEKYLSLAGVKRHCPLHLPYFAASIRAVVGTNLIATVPRRIAECEANDPALKILKAPPEIGSFNYLMLWHPRMNNDAAHIWLRSVIKQIGNHASNT